MMNIFLPLPQMITRFISLDRFLENLMTQTCNIPLMRIFMPVINTKVFGARQTISVRQLIPLEMKEPCVFLLMVKPCCLLAVTAKMVMAVVIYISPEKWETDGLNLSILALR